jgi:hypothetical protein
MRTPTIAAVCLSLASLAAGEGRYEALTAQMAKGPAFAPVAATWFGGTGVDEFVDAAILADGRILAIGNSWGPDFPAEVQAAVIGRGKHSGAPAISSKSAKKGQPPTQQVDEASPDRSGFCAIYAPGLASMASCWRLDWGVGSLSAAIAVDGAVYVVGTAGPAVATLPGISGTGSVLVLRLGDDGKPRWIRRLGPEAKDGRGLALWRTKEAIWVRWTGGGKEGVSRLDADGGSVAVAGERSLDDTQAFLCVAADGTLLYGGDRNTHTGKEPWRQPFLYGLGGDGSKRFTLWEWTSKDLRKDGHPSYGLVADSSPRNAIVDPRTGDWLVTGWSDGGNSVLTRQPTDVAKQLGKPANGFSTFGMKGANSLGYIMRMDPASHEVKAWSYLVAYVPGTFMDPKRRGAPNFIAIDDLRPSDQSDIVVTGLAATGLIQTPNAFWADPKDGRKYHGRFVSVFSQDLVRLRFSSYLPGYETAAAVSAGSSLVVVGRSAKDDGVERATAPPVRAALQKACRGPYDGHLILLAAP